jgi:hypothetical protein
MGPGNPGRTAGAAFQMYYQMGNFVPWRNAAWVPPSERATVLSRRYAECATRDWVAEAVSSAATTAAAISEQSSSFGSAAMRTPYQFSSCSP